jgi:hypothetical protein
MISVLVPQTKEVFPNHRRKHSVSQVVATSSEEFSQLLSRKPSCFAAEIDYQAAEGISSHPLPLASMATVSHQGFPQSWVIVLEGEPISELSWSD